MVDGWLKRVWPLNPVDGVLRWLQNAVNQSCSYAGSKLGRETDNSRDGKDKIVQQHKVEVSQPLKPAVITQQVEVGNTWTNRHKLQSSCGFYTTAVNSNSNIHIYILP